MTMPSERHNAVTRTRQFLLDLMSSKKTPNVPSSVRENAYRCLKHYPSEYDMEIAAEDSPKTFGKWNSNHE